MWTESTPSSQQRPSPGHPVGLDTRRRVSVHVSARLLHRNRRKKVHQE